MIFLKRIVLAVILSLLALVSCSKSGGIKQEHFDIPFESTVKVEYEGAEYLIALEMKAYDDVSLTFIKPEKLNNMKLVLNQGKTSIVYRGISIPIEGDYAKDNGILQLLQVFTADKSTYDSAKIVKVSGVKYCRQRYINGKNCVDIYFLQDSNSPSFIDAALNGRVFRVTFVNE